MAEETEKPIPMRLGDLLTAWEVEAQDAHEAYQSGQARGPVTALPALDEAIGGHLHPGLHILHGAPGLGKTALALQLAATCGTPSVFVTCEMSPLVLLRRVAARVTETALTKFTTGELAPDVSMDLARRAVASAPDMWLLNATTCYPRRADIQNVAQAARGDGRHVLVVVDSVHAWAQGAGDALTEYEAMNAHLKALNDMALDLNCAVLAVAERNRASMSKGGMSAGAGTRKLEYGAWTVLSLQRQNEGEDGEESLIEMQDEIPVVLKVQKNRSGSAGKKILLNFHKPFQRLSEPEW